MKIRTTLLVACMLVVPAAALFSHRIPSGVRSAVRGVVADGIGWLKHRASGETQAAQAPPGPSGSLPAPRQTEAVPSPAAPVAPAADAAIAAASEPAAAAPPAVTRQPEGAVGQLVALGAVAIECRPLQGLEGVHVASCRVGLDASGQLMRVFQASGVTADEATAALAADVLGWKQRMAARQGVDAAAAARRF